MEKRRCPGCMELTEEAVCPVCSWRSEQGNAPHQLQPGTVLRGQYVIGKVLGQGGFGITYLGWDRESDRAIAIKEFFPSSMVTRDVTHGTEVQFFTANSQSRYDASRERFLREARALAKFSEVQEIVGIYSCFEENNTAYIVMEYIKGSNLVRYTQNAGGRLSAEETLRILRPIMAALDKVHQAGIVHRDISPDNIVLEPMGGAKLLDFGAARVVENPDADKDMDRSTEAIVKQGFAPPEQYRSRGSIGPWSDEYALCATIYYCLTGRIPPDAVSRSVGEEQLDWSGVPGLTKGQRAALEKGMAVSAKNRYPSVGELSKALFPETPEPRPIPQPEKPRPAPKPEKPKPSGHLKWAAAAGFVVAAVAGILLLTGRGKTPLPSGGESTPAAMSASVTEPERVPSMEPAITPGTEPESIARTENTVSPEEPSGVVLKLKKTDITFTRIGVTCQLELDCDLKPEDVTWLSLNPEVATCDNGLITAFGYGTTQIVAQYGGQEAVCIVRCKSE
ncbi:MAG: serine/threonine-protein kinase [Candidatus Faecousia sp.]|nr:serine/threonine protein kinase [Clostridiales bacterium]MDY6179260.1 serine/threonine-protein kinase [Candidatus Faecousia sp.]